MTHVLDALFRPRSVVFIGGRNLSAPLRYHRALGFAGKTYVVSPKHDTLEGYACHASVEALPEAPDLAFIAIRREAAVEAVAALNAKGSRAAICNAAGFAELHGAGADLQAALTKAATGMALLGPNALGMVNFVDPMAANMDNFGTERPEAGVAIVSQGGGLLCDVIFADRSVPITHLVGCGNQAVTGVADCATWLLEDPRVRAVGLSFEGLPDVDRLRAAAARALDLGKPLVVLKVGISEVGARAALTHTASMAGAFGPWAALFDRLGIVAVRDVSEFLETLKLFARGHVPRGRRALVTAASGVMGVMVADALDSAGFTLPQPSGATAARLAGLLPGIATPGNPQDVTMAAWNDRARQAAIYGALVEEGAYDIALIAQNYPRAGQWDVAEYAAQVEAMADACMGREVVGAQIAPLVDCFPPEARAQTVSLGLAAVQGLCEGILALGHAADWRARAEVLSPEANALAEAPSLAAKGVAYDEARAKTVLDRAGIPVPRGVVARPEAAAEAAAGLRFPVVLKALDARLVHKTEAGAVRLGLGSAQAVQAAVDEMCAAMVQAVPDVRLARVLIEEMAQGVVAEVMASVTQDATIGPVMMIAGGGTQAELWNDHVLLAPPFTRAEIDRALARLRVATLLEGWRGGPVGDRSALLDALEALGRLALSGAVAEVEVNPILVRAKGVVAVDAVVRRATEGGL